MECDRPVKGIDMEAQLKEWEEKYGHEEKFAEKRKHPASKLDDIAVLPGRDREGGKAPKKGTSDGLGGVYSF